MNMNKDIAEVMLRRKRLIIPDAFPDVESIPENNPSFGLLNNISSSEVFAATFCKNIESLGYTPTKELFEKIVSSEKDLFKIEKPIIDMLIKLKGGDIEYKPMYPNFPEQVMEMDEAEFYINAIVHYWTEGKWTPEYEKENREILSEKTKLIPLGIGSIEDVEKFEKVLLNSAKEWSQNDVSDIETIIKEQSLEETKEFLNSVKMDNKENIALLSKILVNVYGEKGLECVEPNIKTPTDVLRIMNVIHGNGDASLSKGAKIQNISRAFRKQYLRLINNCDPRIAEEDMKIRCQNWIKVGEKLHPSEEKMKKSFSVAAKYFDTIRDSVKLRGVETYNSKIEKAISQFKTELSTASLKKIKSPGIIARRLDDLLRNSEDNKAVIDLWQKKVNAISPDVLWSVWAHFKNEKNAENITNKMRVFNSKNGAVYTTKDKRENIAPEVCEKIMSITFDALKEKYSEKEFFDNKKVYVAPDLENIKIPNNNRNSSKASVSMSRGSKFALGENANTVRAFIWWTNNPGGRFNDRVDIDISATTFDKNFKKKHIISYFGYKTGYGCISGDKIDGGDCDGKGVAEFIDIDVNKAKKEDVRYVLFSINSFTNQNFSNIKNLRFGYMEREKMKSGEIFEPSTVQQYITPTAKATCEAVCAFDIEERKMIWIDTPVVIERSINNAITTHREISALLYKSIHLEKPSVHDVLQANIKGAKDCMVVDDISEADIAFVNIHQSPIDKCTEIIEVTPDITSGMLMPEKMPKEKEVKEEKVLTEEELLAEIEKIKKEIHELGVKCDKLREKIETTKEKNINYEDEIEL